MRIQIITRVPTPLSQNLNTHTRTHSNTQAHSSTRGANLADRGFGALVSDLGKRRSEILLTRCSFEASHCNFFFFFPFGVLLCDFSSAKQSTTTPPPSSPAHTLTCKTALEMFSTLEPFAPLKLHTKLEARQRSETSQPSTSSVFASSNNWKCDKKRSSGTSAMRTFQRLKRLCFGERVPTGKAATFFLLFL